MKKAVAAGMITLFAGAGLVATGTSASAAPATQHQAVVRDDNHGEHGGDRWGDHHWGDHHWGDDWGNGWGNGWDWGDHHWGDHHDWGGDHHGGDHHGGDDH